MHKDSKPVVSVVCLSYNQSGFIRECLDSILMQQTGSLFTYEVLINDDASTDGTVDIIKEYQKKYPDIIKPIFHKENQYSKGKRNMIIRYLLPKAKGQYIALCEGDDFWINPKKLQKQVDFLEKHKDYMVCFHPVKVVYENSEKPDSIFPTQTDRNYFTTKNLLIENFIQTNSVMYKRQSYKDMSLDVMPGDWYLHLYHAKFGKIGFIKETMAVYRRHEKGIWWDSQNDIDKICEKHGLAHMALYLEMLQLFSDKDQYRLIIYEHIYRLLNNLMRIDTKKKTTELLDQLLSNFPGQTAVFLQSQYRGHILDEATIDDKERQVNSLHQQIIKKDRELMGVNTELTQIKSSLTWRMRNRAARVIKKDIVS